MRLSAGLATKQFWAWVSEPFVKTKLARSLELEQIRPELVDQLLGENLEPRKEGILIWLHAPSLNQTKSFGEVVAHFADRDDVNFLWTTEEDDPQEKFNLPGIHQHVPLDHPNFVTKFLKHYKPDALVWLSDTISPILLRKVARTKIPAIYANAGLSRAQAKRYIWFPNFIGIYLSSFDRILAKTDEAAKRLRRANAPRSKLEVLGVMHAGARALPHDEMERSRLAKQLDNRPVWLAAHTSTDEIAMLGKTQRRVSRVAQGLILVLHVADLTQAKRAIAKLSALGLRITLRDDASMPPPDADVFVVHGQNDLGVFYRLAPVCFLGQSLSNSGGSDPFEAAALGSAILHGPSTENYQSSYDRLTDAGAARKVYNSEMLVAALSETLSPDRAAEMAHGAWEVCSAGAEVNDRVIELLDGYLDKGAAHATA